MLGPDSVEVRVVNESTVRFDQVIVVFPSGEERYGAVEPGEATGYRAVEEAYRYAYVEVRFGEVMLVLQPIDYVGETLLTPGRYSYVLDVQGGSSLVLELRRD